MRSVRQTKRNANVEGETNYAEAYAKYKDYQKRYRDEHRERYRNYSKKYREQHPKKLLGERTTQNIFETRDPEKLHSALQRELKRIGIRH